MSRERDADPAGRARPTREELEASQKALLESEARLRQMNAELERHVAERTAALQASEARLRTIFETSYQYQGLLALDGTLLEANAASLEGIEAAVSDVVGKPFWDTPWFTGTPGMPTKVREAVALVASGQIVGARASSGPADGPAGVRFLDAADLQRKRFSRGYRAGSGRDYQTPSGRSGVAPGAEDGSFGSAHGWDCT